MPQLAKKFGSYSQLCILPISSSPIEIKLRKAVPFTGTEDLKFSKYFLTLFVPCWVFSAIVIYFQDRIEVSHQSGAEANVIKLKNYSCKFFCNKSQMYAIFLWNGAHTF